LTTNSPTYDRFGGFGIYYYEAIMITVPETGGYAVESDSSIDTYGYLYLNSFNPLNIEENLIEGVDDYMEQYDFRIVYGFESTKTYILVVTTHNQLDTGPFSIIAWGPKPVTLTSVNITSTITTTRLTTQSSLTTTFRGCK
jgi:hypothetical protein